MHTHIPNHTYTLRHNPLSHTHTHTPTHTHTRTHTMSCTHTSQTTRTHFPPPITTPFHTYAHNARPLLTHTMSCTHTSLNYTSYTLPNSHHNPFSHTHTRTHTHAHVYSDTHIHTLTLTLLHTSLPLSFPNKAQNRWLRENTIDAHGNLFCRDCLVACLGVHTSRIQHQRMIKQEQPIIQMSKEEVEEKRLVEYVLRKDEVLPFMVWWKTGQGRSRGSVPTRSSRPCWKTIQPRQAGCDEGVFGLRGQQLTAKWSSGRQLQCSLLSTTVHQDSGTCRGRERF